MEDIALIIARGLKRSRVVVKTKGQDPQTGYRVAAKYVLEELTRGYDVTPKAVKPGHKTWEMYDG